MQGERRQHGDGIHLCRGKKRRKKEKCTHSGLSDLDEKEMKVAIKKQNKEKEKPEKEAGKEHRLVEKVGAVSIDPSTGEKAKVQSSDLRRSKSQKGRTISLQGNTRDQRAGGNKVILCEVDGDCPRTELRGR